MAWGIPYVPASGSSASTVVGDRNLTLENVLGNLMIAQYQVDKLQERLADHISYDSNLRESRFMFKHKDDWFEVKMSVQRQEKKKEEEPDPNPNNEKIAPTP